MLSFYVATLAMLLPLAACAGVGFVWARRDLPFSGQFLTLLVTSVSTPSLVLHTLYTSRISNRELMDLMLVSLLILLACMALAALILRVLQMPVRMFLQTASFPNAGNFGLPMAGILFGDAGLTVAVGFFAVCSFVQNTIGVQSLPRGPSGVSWKSPVLFAAVIAITARMLPIGIPEPVLNAAHLVGSLTVPLMLISLGYAMSSIPLSGLRAGAVVAVIRLMVGPAAGWAITSMFGLSGVEQGTLILQAMMPCAVISYIFASRYTTRAEVSAGAVMISTILFILLSPFVALMLDAPLAR